MTPAGVHVDMYLDYSLRKIALLLGIVILMFSFVYATHIAKGNTFGSTPYFYAISVGARYLAHSFAALFSQEPNSPSSASAPGIPILTYHRVLDSQDVNNVTLSVFRDQMRTLKDAGWETITLQEFEDFMAGKKSLPEKSFLLTFDDGAKQSFYPVDPILRELGYEASIFIIVDSSKTPESTYYMTPEEIRWMLKTGRWSIGSHSYDGHRPYPVDQNGTTGIFFADRIWHTDAARLETNEEFTARVRKDLTDAKHELEETYGVPIRTLAFPLGNESGILGANNFPEGSSITEKEAEALYDFGFVQLNNQQYTFNYPATTTDTFAPAFPFTTERLSRDFLVHRIHVDYDWDGARLLSIMENGLAKDMPYEDDFSVDRGWIPAWGSMEIGRNNFELAAVPEMSGASAFLDGTALWDNYSFETSVNWDHGYVILLADVVDSKTYHSCSFSEGNVQIQSTVDGVTSELKHVRDTRIAYSDTARMGIRVHGSVIECTWNFESVAEVYTRDYSGGIGIQVWDPALGTASAQFSSLIVRPFGAE